MKRRVVDLVVLAAVGIGGYFAIINAQAIGDWWYFLRNEPSAEMEKLAADAGMNEEGRKLFLRFSPAFANQTEINRHCGEKLGCVFGQELYILEPHNKAEYNRAIVTASHEMLHIAYSRLSDDEISRLETEIQKQMQTLPNPELDEKLSGYPADERLNEAHSFIGSEIQKITDQLEQHYGQYFSDRSKTVEAYQLSPES